MALLAAVVVPYAVAVKMQLTENGMSVGGMFYARIAAIRAKHMRASDSAKVCFSRSFSVCSVDNCLSSTPQLGYLELPQQSSCM